MKSVPAMASNIQQIVRLSETTKWSISEVTLHSLAVCPMRPHSSRKHDMQSGKADGCKDSERRSLTLKLLRDEPLGEKQIIECIRDSASQHPWR